MTWDKGRPMDSAPRDGTRILVWVERWQEFVIAYYEDPPMDAEGWYTDEGRVFCNPTHWWPLPKRPCDG